MRRILAVLAVLVAIGAGAAAVIALRPAPVPALPSAAVSQAASALPQLKPENGSPVIRPVLIAFSADGGNIIGKLTWPVWSDEEAVGNGTRTLQSCKPNCAQGTDTEVPERLVLSRPVDGYFTEIVATFAGQVQLYTAGDSTGVWPLSAQ